MEVAWTLKKSCAKDMNKRPGNYGAGKGATQKLIRLEGELLEFVENSPGGLRGLVEAAYQESQSGRKKTTWEFRVLGVHKHPVMRVSSDSLQEAYDKFLAEHYGGHYYPAKAIIFEGHGSEHLARAEGVGTILATEL